MKHILYVLPYMNLGGTEKQAFSLMDNLQQQEDFIMDSTGFESGADDSQSCQQQCSCGTKFLETDPDVSVTLQKCRKR